MKEPSDGRLTPGRGDLAAKNKCLLMSDPVSPNCAMRDVEATMPAIASLEDLKAAQKDLPEVKNLDELKAAFKRWRKIGWKDVCKEINEAIAA